MTKRECGNCRWWQNDQHAIGACMRYPPGVSELVPKTHATDWCGEWADATITPEQEDLQELIRRFAVAIMSAEYAAEPCLRFDRIWAAAQNMAAAEPQIQREGQQ